MRRYPNLYWSATSDTLSENTKNRLNNWAVRVLLGINGIREDDLYMPVTITELSSTTNSEYTANDIAFYIFLKRISRFLLILWHDILPIHSSQQ